MDRDVPVGRQRFGERLRRFEVHRVPRLRNDDALGSGDQGREAPGDLDVLEIPAAGKKEHVAAETARHSGSGVAIDTRVVDGEPVATLIEAARDGGYDLVVMGNRGMTGVTRFLRLGSVPNKACGVPVPTLASSKLASEADLMPRTWLHHWSR